MFYVKAPTLHNLFFYFPPECLVVSFIHFLTNSSVIMGSLKVVSLSSSSFLVLIMKVVCLYVCMTVYFGHGVKAGLRYQNLH